MRLIESTTWTGGIWMELRDRKKLQRLMIVQEVSQRKLAQAAGWKSHSYLGRLLRGQEKTLDTTPALLIAHFLKVGVEDLFLTRVENEPTAARVKPSKAA